MDETINDSLKDLVAQLELDKQKLAQRIRDLCDENAELQSKNRAAFGGSEREDSPDVLSELDKHEELLTNISQKNKHIKRLLRDIESLESQAAGQVEQIKSLHQHLAEATRSVTMVTAQLVDHKQKIAEQSSDVTALTSKVVELSGQIAGMQRDRDERELEIQEFGQQLEQRALVWKQMLEEKDERLESLRSKYEHVLALHPGYDIDSDRAEMARMSEAIGERDELIGELESKLLSLSREMIGSTDIMNKLAKDREHGPSAEPVSLATGKQSCCCDELRTMLNRSSARCAELQEMIMQVEEDNVQKSRCAMDAAEALAAIKSGENGLANALKKNAELQTKVQSRDKHVRSLIMELNAMQEISQENLILRFVIKLLFF